MLAPEMLTDKAARSLQGLVPCAMGLCESYCSSLSEDTDTMCLSPSNTVPSHWQSVTPFGQAATAGNHLQPGLRIPHQHLYGICLIG